MTMWVKQLLKKGNRGILIIKASSKRVSTKQQKKDRQ